MQINYIKTIGFRKFENEFETNLYNVSTITGGNTKGKTNILYAIIWAFLGTNITGDDKVWIGNKNSDDCYVELKFTDNNGIQHTLERYKNRYNNKRNYILLDNNRIEAEELQKYYSDKKLFLSILNPNYFINKKPAEQKELLEKYLPLIDVETIYNQLDDTEKGLLETVPTNIIDYIKELNSNKKMCEDRIKNIRGRIDYASNVLNEIVEDKKVFEQEEELSLARQELSFLTTNTKKVDREKQQKIVDNIENQITEKEQQIRDITIQMTTGKKIYLSIKSSPVSTCPMCEQEIKDESRQTTINNIKKELEEQFEKKNELEKILQDLKSKILVEKCKLHSLEESQDRQKDIERVQEQIKNLEQKQLEIQKFNNTIEIKINNMNGAKQDITHFKKEINENEMLIDNIRKTKKVAEKLFINYIEEKMKFATTYLQKVKIKYYSVLKDTGELKEDFIITYNDNELKTLSRSETIATSLEISNMLNKISGINLPLFIDDSESCADYNFVENYSKDTQILIARVEKGQDLSIKEGYINNNDYLQVA